MDSYLHKLDKKKLSTKYPLSAVASVAYHDMFDYPLSFKELLKWKGGIALKNVKSGFPVISNKKGYFFLQNRKELILKRHFREESSKYKLKIAKKASQILGKIPSIKMVAVSGSLAMNNAQDDDDIDFLIITQKGQLWFSRIIAYIILIITRIDVRASGNSKEKDKICLNIWLDESDLCWPERDRNVYTAHEIAQIKVLLNKNRTYENFLNINNWITDYWPNAITIKYESRISSIKSVNKILSLIETICYFMQLIYMRRKITREKISRKRALFHPFDWSAIVLGKLKTI